jgi:hypothetical protein
LSGKVNHLSTAFYIFFFSLFLHKLLNNSSWCMQVSSPHYHQPHTITSFQPWTDSTIKLPVTPLYNVRATEAPKCLATITAFKEDSTPMHTEYTKHTWLNILKQFPFFLQGENVILYPQCVYLPSPLVTQTT